MCTKSLACSIRFDLQVPDEKGSIQLKVRERAKLDNPLNASKLKMQVKKRKDKNKSSEAWAQCFETCGDIQEGSAAAATTMANANRQKLVVRRV
jgi:hypothetical protein